MAKLSAAQVRVLRSICSWGGSIVREWRHLGPPTGTMLRTLTADGYVKHLVSGVYDKWEITDDGRAALAEAEREEGE